VSLEAKAGPSFTVTNPRLGANSRCRSRLHRSLHAAGDLLNPPHGDLLGELLRSGPAVKDATGLDAHRGDLPDGEHRAQTALVSEPARAAAGVDELGVEAAAVGHSSRSSSYLRRSSRRQDADEPLGGSDAGDHLVGG
jgi:hypothetical protein